ncbi:hypothetical protein A7C99_4801 [Trichophyton rubrum]|uniref:Uncharacterized protein n=1 Tax=Trichophyton rubrum TaxID=5551 RepID=A0A178EVN4_TRIRU|nr:hypothetical protein A7C99_4801 [Trichophyton rubrum]
MHDIVDTIPSVISRLSVRRAINKLYMDTHRWPQTPAGPRRLGMTLALHKHAYWTDVSPFTYKLTAPTASYTTLMVENLANGQPHEYQKRANNVGIKARTATPLP